VTHVVETFVGGYGDPGIHAFALDEATGALHLLGTHSGVVNPSFVLPHPDGHHLYAVSETGLDGDGVTGGVHALRIERSGGRVNLVPLGERSSEGDHPCHLELHRSGRWLAVSNYTTGSVVVFPVEPDGGLGERTALVQHEGSGPNRGRQEGPHAHSSLFSADGRFLVVADLGIDRLIVYRFDDRTGTLTRFGDTATASGAGPRHMAFTSDGAHVLVVGELDNTLSAYAWHDGVLRHLSTIEVLPADAPETTSADLHVAGRHAYVSNRGHDSIAVATFEPTDGLRLEAIRPCGGAWPRGFGITPGGRHVLVANRHSDEVVLVPIERDGADLGVPVARGSVPQPSCVAFASVVDG
jgi:6-phosphogluconolactonase